MQTRGKTIILTATYCYVAVSCCQLLYFTFYLLQVVKGTKDNMAAISRAFQMSFLLL